MDKCQFADYEGKISHIGDYTTCDGRTPLPSRQLTIHPADYTQLDGGQSLEDRVVLLSGTILLPASQCQEWRMRETPDVPVGWPVGSVWVAGLPFSSTSVPTGEFVGCWFDMGRNVDRCQFADYTGKVLYVGNYTTCDGRSLLPSRDLKVSPARLLRGSYRASDIEDVELEDGTALIPVSACEARKNSP